MAGIVAARVHRYLLPLRRQWQTAAGGLTSREGWLLRIDLGDGRSGYGDCAPLAASGTETAATAKAALGDHLRRLTGLSAADALATLDRTPGNKAPAARCAVETALLDLIAQQCCLPLANLLKDASGSVTDVRPTTSVTLNAALGSLSDVTDETILAACAAGFRVLKLKVGVCAVEHEVARLHRVTTLLPTGVVLRLDANRAWRASDAVRFVRACAGQPVDMIEEPLAAPQIEALRRLQSSTAIAIAVDESAAALNMQRLLDTRPIRRLVLKPARCAGLLRAIGFARHAADAGFECVITSTVDSACGVAAAAHLAAAVDNGLAHGLATSSWLAEDTGAPPQITNGRLLVSQKPGLGFSPWPNLDFAEVVRHQGDAEQQASSAR